jgi:hypothetical protein
MLAFSRRHLMELLKDLGLNTGMTVGVVAVVLLGLTILLSMSAYAAQKWAYKTYLETKSVNEKLGRLLELAQSGSGIRQEPRPVSGKPGGKRREPTIGRADI